MQKKVARDGRECDQFDINFFTRKISAYEVVFESVTAQFIDDVYGPYANQVSRQHFANHLLTHGWKYLELKHLNELFSIKYAELQDQGAVQQVDQLNDSAFLSSLRSLN